MLDAKVVTLISRAMDRPSKARSGCSRSDLPSHRRVPTDHARLHKLRKCSCLDCRRRSTTSGQKLWQPCTVTCEPLSSVQGIWYAPELSRPPMPRKSRYPSAQNLETSLASEQLLKLYLTGLTLSCKLAHPGEMHLKVMVSGHQ